MSATDLTIASFQKHISARYEKVDRERGWPKTFAFFIEEIGPSIYNKGVADAQERMQMRAQELDIECHEDEFRYWHKVDRKR